MGPAHRFRHDLVDDAERQQIRRREFQGRRRFHLARGVAPQDRGAAFGWNDAVDGELVHQDTVADRNAEGAAAAALATHVYDDGDVEQRHLAKVHGDGLGYPAFLRLHARVGGGRVDKHDDGAAELLRQPHPPERLAVTLRLRITEVPEDLLLGVAAPLVVPDNEHRHALVEGGARHDGVIVSEPSITMDLDEIAEQETGVLEHARPGRVTSNLYALPRRQVTVDFGADRLCPAPQPLDLRFALGGCRQHRQRLDLLEQDADRFFEFQQIWHVSLVVHR